MNKPINILVSIIISMFAFASVFTTPANAFAENSQFEILTILNSKDDCDKTNNPNAPCKSEVFQIDSQTKSTTKSVTCGVNVFTATGTKVATISETVTFTVGASTMYYKVNSASRSVWVKNSSYQWKNVNGPSPSSGSDVMLGVSGPSTYGDLHFLGGYWNTWRTTLVVNSASSWYCR